MGENITELIEKALEMRSFSYTPYSHYRVGAALLGANGRIYPGCNIENAAFTPGICAERTAIARAVSSGERDFAAIVITGGPEGCGPEELQYCAPCGVCRQVLREFCSDDFRVILARSTEDYRVYTLAELLPESFGPDNLKIRGSRT